MHCTVWKGDERIVDDAIRSLFVVAHRCYGRLAAEIEAEAGAGHASKACEVACRSHCSAVIT